jgi:hypothetical protein
MLNSYDAQFNEDLPDYINDYWKLERLQRDATKSDLANNPDYQAFLKLMKGKELFCRKFVIGGKEGGSCYGDKAVPITDIEQPDDSFFTEIIVALAPTLPVKQFFDIKQEVLRVRDRDAWSYYGNYTEYKDIYFLTYDLWRALAPLDLPLEELKSTFDDPKYYLVRD